MADLPHTLEGYIQEQETAFRRATDENVYQKIGKDLNYLKDQVDTTEALAIATFAVTSQIVISALGFGTDGSGNYQALVSTSPNGKPILFAAVFAQIAGYQNPFPLLCVGPSVSLAMWAGGGISPPSYQGNFPLVSAQFTGVNNESLYLSLANGAMTGGKFTSPTWSPGTGGVFRYTYVYPT